MGARVAIVTDYLKEYGGAERTLEAIHDLFPDSPVFTSVFDSRAFPDSFKDWDIRTLKAEQFPLYNTLAKQYSLLYPVLFESLDLSDFDIIISSSTAWAKSVITKPHQLHICYLHTPPRFLYRYSVESAKRNNWYYKPVVAYIDHFLRFWDFVAAKRPDFFIANSKTVAERISKFYRREAMVIYPPVKTNRELVVTEGSHRFKDNYYLCVSRLSKYKNVHLLIEAFNNMDFALRIVGTGKEYGALRSSIRHDIALLGSVEEKELNLLYQRCKGFIFPVVDEDFGISAVEALSYGKPVLAHRSGGPTEFIIDGKNGMFFESLAIPEMIKTIIKFDDAINSGEFDPKYIKDTATRFDEKVFKDQFVQFVSQKWSEKNNS